MTFNKRQSKIIAMGLILFLTTMLLPISFVSAGNSNGVNYEEISNNCIEIDENGIKSRITIIKNDEEENFKVIVKDLNNNKENIFIVNDGKVTSSITGATINVEPQVSKYATGDISYKCISYAKIKKMVGTSASVADIAAAIIALCGAAATPVGAVTILIAAIGGLVSNVMNGSSSKGIKIKLKETVRRTTKNGKVYRYKSYQIVGVSTY